MKISISDIQFQKRRSSKWIKKFEVLWLLLTCTCCVSDHSLTLASWTSVWRWLVPWGRNSGIWWVPWLTIWCHTLIDHRLLFYQQTLDDRVPIIWTFYYSKLWLVENHLQFHRHDISKCNSMRQAAILFSCKIWTGT